MTLANAYRDMYRTALLIRRVEEKIIEVYATDKIQSPVHLSIGQEAVSVGMCRAVAPQDLIYGTYRSHALYIACGGDLTLMFAELMGRIGGISKGKAGSMHLSCPTKGLMGSSAIVASHIPHAAGSALAAKLRQTNQVIWCVFGDGSTEEGVMHEVLNISALKKLPILFLCENNSLAVHAAISDRQAYRIQGLAELYGIPYTRLEEGYDFQAVHSVCDRLAGDIRQDGGPRFLEVLTYRSKEHVGTNDDFHFGYRDRAPFEAWCARDPLIQDKATYDSLIAEIDAEIEAAMASADTSPAPGIEELLTDVW